MAEQKDRDKKALKSGGDGDTPKAGEDGGGRGGRGLFLVDYFKNLRSNPTTKRTDGFSYSYGPWDVLGGVIPDRIGSREGETIDGLRAESIELNWETMMQPIFHSARARSLATRIVELCGGSAFRRDHVHRPVFGHDGGWDGLDTKENVEALDFGRDTNRLDYFRVTPFDVHASNDSDLRGIANYGGGFRTVGNSSYNGCVGSGGSSGGGCRSGCGDVVGPRPDQEKGSTSAGGGDRTRQVAVGIFVNNDSGCDDGGGKVVIRRLEEEKGGAGTVDGEEGERLVVGGWWNNWWLLVALWK